MGALLLLLLPRVIRLSSSSPALVWERPWWEAMSWSTARCLALTALGNSTCANGHLEADA